MAAKLINDKIWDQVESGLGGAPVGAVGDHLPEAVAPGAGAERGVGETMAEKRISEDQSLGAREKAEIHFGDAAHIRSDHHAGRTWGKKGETPIVLSTGKRYRMSMISAITSKGHLRFMIKERGGVNADVFIEFLKRLLIGAKQKIFLIVDRGPAHTAKKTSAFIKSLNGALRLFFLPPYSPDKNLDERSSLRSLQRNPEKIRSFFQKESLKYAA
jgi:transposase